MNDQTPGTVFSEILQNNEPQAVAWIRGNTSYPQLSGSVKFYNTPYMGILIEAEVYGLPNIQQVSSSNFYAMHIHSNGDCTPPLQRTGEHYSRVSAMHPKHNGDLLPLLGNQGYAWLTFYDKKITIAEIIGRSVIIHENPDDFESQPSGNSGNKIACGVIQYM